MFQDSVTLPIKMRVVNGYFLESVFVPLYGTLSVCVEEIETGYGVETFGIYEPNLTSLH